MAMMLEEEIPGIDRKSVCPFSSKHVSDCLCWGKPLNQSQGTTIPHITQPRLSDCCEVAKWCTFYTDHMLPPKFAIHQMFHSPKLPTQSIFEEWHVLKKT
jgi:hypothetical protein